MQHTTTGLDARQAAIVDWIARVTVRLVAAPRIGLETWRRRWRARVTARALEGLDDRTLHDIGVHRSRIDAIAREALERGDGC